MPLSLTVATPTPNASTCASPRSSVVVRLAVEGPQVTALERLAGNHVKATRAYRSGLDLNAYIS